MSVDSLKAKGNEFFKQKNFTEAIDCYSKAIELDPNSEATSALYSNRAACWQSLNNFQKALEDSDQCIRVRPAWLKGHFRKGTALQSMNLLDEARKCFQEALRVEPGSADVGEKLTELNNKIRDRNDKAKPLSCKTPEEGKLIGNSLFSEGKYDRAAEFYTRAIDLQKTDTQDKANFYANRAACYQQTHLYQQMVEDCNAAIQIDPNHVKAFMRRAIAYEGMEKWKLALEDYQKAKQLAPSLAVISQGVLRCQRAIRG